MSVLDERGPSCVALTRVAWRDGTLSTGMPRAHDHAKTILHVWFEADRLVPNIHFQHIRSASRDVVDVSGN
jgi:hypothetical protein